MLMYSVAYPHSSVIITLSAGPDESNDGRAGRQTLTEALWSSVWE